MENSTLSVAAPVLKTVLQVLGRLHPIKKVAESEWADIAKEAATIWTELKAYAALAAGGQQQVVGNTCTVGDLEVIDTSSSECADDYM